MDSAETPHGDGSPLSGAANAPVKHQSPRKRKRSTAKLVTLGATAAIAAGAFAAVTVSGAQAAEMRTDAVQIDVIRTADGEEDEQAEINEANTLLAPGLCGTPPGEPNPQRKVLNSLIFPVDENGLQSADKRRVTLTLECGQFDNPPPQKPGFDGG